MRRVGWLPWLLVAALAYADPAAEEHQTRGKRLLTVDKDYAAAEAEFAAAYAIDHDPRYLFNLALARRLGGKCRDAIASYREFLATHRDGPYANNARAGIDICERILAREPPPAPRCGDGVLAGAEACDDGNADAGDGCSATCTVDMGWACSGQPSSCSRIALPPPAVVVETRAPWYRDRLGNTLTISGGVVAIAAVTLQLLARRAASSTFDFGPLDDYESSRDRARLYETTSWIAAGTGVALIAGGVIRYAIRPDRVVRERRDAVTIVPRSDGATITFGGSW